MHELLLTALCVFWITALTIDFCYTIIFWLVNWRPHRWWRYHLLLGLLGLEATIVALLWMQLFIIN